MSRAWGLGAYVPFLASLRSIICFCRHKRAARFKKNLIATSDAYLVTCSDGEYERHLGSFQHDHETLIFIFLANLGAIS